MNKVGPVEGIARSMVYIWEAGCGQAGDEAGELGRTQITLGLVIHATEGSKGPHDLMGRKEANWGRKATAIVRVKGKDGRTKARGQGMMS